MIRYEKIESPPVAVDQISVANARLPQTYENARKALSNCASIDECKDWKDKAQALASYARMADDDSLHKMAVRIQARAVRRCGQLLEQFDARGNNQHGVGADTIPQHQAASDAGLSKRQQVTAVRVSRVSEAEFEAAVESDAPPTITKLAEQGKKPQTPHPVPAGFPEATKLIGNVNRFAEFCSEKDPEFVAGGVLPSEVKKIRERVSRIDAWLDRFVVNLEC